MIGRADIEGSKSNVAMNAWLPQASYPCGNFSDTSGNKLYSHKGSIGHAFTVRIGTEDRNQESFYPFVPSQISVLTELSLGHLRCFLTDVPPQPNSPPGYVTVKEDCVTQSSPENKCCHLFPFHPLSRASSRVVVFQDWLPSHLRYTPRDTPQNQARVKLNRVFFPR